MPGFSLFPSRYYLYSLVAFVCLLLSACGSTQTGLRALDTHQSSAHGSRVRYIVLHYTAGSYTRSLQTLTGPDVSAHYLISDHHPPKLHRLLSEDRRAWHAGLGSWYGNTDINTGSIGIEIVNHGQLGPDQWDPYIPEQIELLRLLLNDLVHRHQIAPQNIIGHSDMAPQRKIDPGPLFPWEQLAQSGLGRWYDEKKSLALQAHYLTHPFPSVTAQQQLLLDAGYEVELTGQADTATRNVITAFQMHYRPTRYDGTMDAETLSILLSLH